MVDEYDMEVFDKSPMYYLLLATPGTIFYKLVRNSEDPEEVLG